MISPANFTGCPTKVAWLTAFFLKKKTIFVEFSCRPPAGQPVSWHMNSCVWIEYLFGNINILVSKPSSLIFTIYVTPAVQEIPNLHKNVPFFIKTLILLISEKHICRFAPLVLSSPEQCLQWATPQGEKY